MRIIEHSQVEETLDIETCINLMEESLISLSNGDAKQIVRPVLPLYESNLLGMMPAYIASKDIAGVKILSVFPHNYALGLPSHQGQILVFETKTGAVKALVDAESITGIRTASASAVATDKLAKKDATVLAILGAGLQGRKHLEAITKIRDITKVFVWDINYIASEKYAKIMHEKMGIEIFPCKTAQEATKYADIICTLTPSIDPIVSLADVKKGVHINAIGACSAKSRELTTDLVKASRLFVDWKNAILKEAGDFLIPFSEGEILETHILAEIGSVLDGSVVGRTSEEDITLFKALGQATEDLVVANYVIEHLIEEKI